MITIVVNGEKTETSCATLGELLDRLNYDANAVATAIDGAFIPRQQRHTVPLTENIKIEVVSPMQGG